MPATAHKKAVPGWTATNSMRPTALPKPATKRKLAANQPKFYAVRVGKKPGVYETYEECRENISGYKGAEHKSFLTMAEAKNYLKGEDPSKPVRFYAVARSRKTGIYTDWDLAKMTIKDWKKPIYKKFDTLAEAETFMRQHGEKPKRVEKADMTPQGSEEDDDDDDDDGEEEDDDDDDDDLKFPPAKKLKADILHIWTDGACASNGKKAAAAGLGVFFGKDDPRNFAERLTGEQTNQRGELMAIKRALEVVPYNQAVKIHSDSQYAINCVTKWAKSWMQKDWLTTTGAPVKNRDLVEETVRLIATRAAKGGATDFQWVEGHANDAGNIAADGLARQGAKMSQS